MLFLDRVIVITTIISSSPHYSNFIKHHLHLHLSICPAAQLFLTFPSHLFFFSDKWPVGSWFLLNTVVIIGRIPFSFPLRFNNILKTAPSLSVLMNDRIRLLFFTTHFHIFSSASPIFVFWPQLGPIPSSLHITVFSFYSSLFFCSTIDTSCQDYPPQSRAHFFALFFAAPKLSPYQPFPFTH